MCALLWIYMHGMFCIICMCCLLCTNNCWLNPLLFMSDDFWDSFNFVSYNFEETTIPAFLCSGEETKRAQTPCDWPLTFSMSHHHKTHFQARLTVWNEKQTNGKCDRILLFCCHLNKPEYINAVLVRHLLLPSKYAVTHIWFGIVWHFWELNLSFLISSSSHFYTSGLKEKVSIDCEPWRIWDLVDVKAWRGIGHGSI